MWLCDIIIIVLLLIIINTVVYLQCILSFEWSSCKETFKLGYVIQFRTVESTYYPVHLQSTSLSPFPPFTSIQKLSNPSSTIHLSIPFLICILLTPLYTSVFTTSSFLQLSTSPLHPPPLISILPLSLNFLNLHYFTTSPSLP